MIIYNLTTQVSWQVHDAWKSWLTERSIPAMLATGVFERYQLVRLLEVDETVGPTYALQLYVSENRSIDDFKKTHQHSMLVEENTLWGDEIISFSSLMRVIN